MQEKEIFHRRDLRGRRFFGDLRGADFSFSNLKGCQFKGCNLTGSDFSNSDLRGCDFRDTILNESNFKGTKTGRNKRQILVLLITGGFLWSLFNSIKLVDFLLYVYSNLARSIKLPESFSRLKSISLFFAPSIEASLSINSLGAYSQTEKDFDDDDTASSFGAFPEDNENLFWKAIKNTLETYKLLIELIASFSANFIGFPHRFFRGVFNTLKAAVLLILVAFSPVFLPLFLSWIVQLALPQSLDVLALPFAVAILISLVIGLVGLVEKTFLALSILIPANLLFLSPIRRIYEKINEYVMVGSQDLRQLLEYTKLSLNSIFTFFYEAHQTKSLYYLLFLSIIFLFLFHLVRMFSFKLLAENLHLSPDGEYFTSPSLCLPDIGYGTSFEGSSAINCDFSDSVLKDSNFEKANLKGSKFKNSFVGMCRFNNADLSIVDWQNTSLLFCFLPEYFTTNYDLVKELCIERSGVGRNYEGRDLRNQFLEMCCLDKVSLKSANLSGSILSQASFKDANLVEIQALDACFSNANLSKANLAGANIARSTFRKSNLNGTNLVGVQALQADFSNSILTDACIDGWGTNSYTKFRDIECDRIFLEDGFYVPKPDSGFFQPGDFEKIIVRSSKTLDLFFRDGIDPQSFDFAFAKLKEKHREAEVESVESWSDGTKIVHVNLQVSPEDRSIGHEQFFVDYGEQLTAANQEIRKLLEEVKDSRLSEAETREKLIEAKARLDEKEQHSKYLEKFALHQAYYANLPGRNASSILTSGGNFMSNENRNIEINSAGDVIGFAGGNIDSVIGKENSGIIGGDFEGVFSITLENLKETDKSENLRLYKMLEELKNFIQDERFELDDKDKQKALKHLNSIGELGSAPETEKPLFRERAESAVDALIGILSKGHKLWALTSPLIVGIQSFFGF